MKLYIKCFVCATIVYILFCIFYSNTSAVIEGALAAQQLQNDDLVVITSTLVSSGGVGAVAFVAYVVSCAICIYGIVMSIHENKEKQ